MLWKLLEIHLFISSQGHVTIFKEMTVLCPWRHMGWANVRNKKNGRVVYVAYNWSFLSSQIEIFIWKWSVAASDSSLWLSDGLCVQEATCLLMCRAGCSVVCLLDVCNLQHCHASVCVLVSGYVSIITIHGRLSCGKRDGNSNWMSAALLVQQQQSVWTLMHLLCVLVQQYDALTAKPSPL